MNCLFNGSCTSIGKKQVVAVTGLLLIGFLIGHLAGNLFIYGGAEAFNGYAHKLEKLRPALYLVEAVLLVIFVIHLTLTALLVYDNVQARPERYAMKESQGPRSLATQLMSPTGAIIVAFVIWHLLDFTFSDHHGLRGILADGESYGLYGVVYNSFSDPFHSLLYIIAMIAIGFHLSHALQSFMQTFGFHSPVYTPVIKKISAGLGIIVATGYSSIPVYVLIQNL